MLKLTYHNTVFGPIDFEYDRAVIRVGRSEDNDLVLRHPSVEPHHCILVFRDTKVLWLRPDPAISSETDLQSVTGPEFGLGDQLQFGELLFNLGRSARTVAIPLPALVNPGRTRSVGEPGDRDSQLAGSANYFCPNCTVSYKESQLKRVGLVGHPKRALCPKCSYVFAPGPEASERSAPLKQSPLRAPWKRAPKTPAK